MGHVVVKSGGKCHRVVDLKVNAMYMGEFSHTIDTKGRVIIPSKLRDALGEGFVVTKGLDGCLFVYDAKEWSSFEEKLADLPTTSREARTFVRFFLAGADTPELDKQGRMLLPQSLRAHADLKKDVVFVGAGRRVEIWDRERWEADTPASPEDMDQIAAKLEEIGLRL